MNLIIAIVRPASVIDIKNALIDAGMAGFTVTEVHGHGRQKGHTEHYRGAEYEIDLLPKSEIKVAVPAEKTASVIEIITKAARTGMIGDGKIFVLPIAQVHRIRTGETGPDAL
jgi:nitrogen regulatory protein P-II 2